MKHILEESQATVKLQPDGVLHSVKAAEEAQIDPSLSLLALLAKKQRTQVLDPPQTQSPHISPLQPPTSSSSSALLISLFSSSPRFLASGRSRNDNRFPSSSVTQIDAAWWLFVVLLHFTWQIFLQVSSLEQILSSSSSFSAITVRLVHEPLNKSLVAGLSARNQEKKSLARSVVKCEESGGEREREREILFTMDCCCCCCCRQALWECGGQQQSSSWILISPPSSTRRTSLSSHTLQRSSSLLSSSSSSALTICTDFQTRISVRRSRRRRKKQHCGGNGAAAVRKSLGPYSDYSNSNSSSRNVPDTPESL